MHDAVLAGFHLAFFFGKRQEQVLGQAPVEEDSDAVDFNDLEAGELADLHLGLFGGGQQLVFAVQVHEDVQPVFVFTGNILGDVAVGQQDLAVRAAIQIQTEVRVFNHLQCVVAPD